jgi:ribosome biogenesis GTPase
MPPLKRDELGGCFADFSEYAHECRFRDCLHYKESECGVKEAVQKKLVPRSRYDNYIAMLEEVISNERCY